MIVITMLIIGEVPMMMTMLMTMMTIIMTMMMKIFLMIVMRSHTRLLVLYPAIMFISVDFPAPLKKIVAFYFLQIRF